VLLLLLWLVAFDDESDLEAFRARSFAVHSAAVSLATGRSLVAMKLKQLSACTYSHHRCDDIRFR